MERKDIEFLLRDIEYKYSLSKDDKDGYPRLYEVGNLALSVALDTASIPEREFVDSLVDLLLQNGIELHSGWMDEDEYDEIFEGNEEGAKEYLEMFINPKNMFLGGKIRPDVVFRKGKGNCIIFEIDSFQYHSSQEQLTADKVRERKIQSLGHPVFRFSAKECLDGKAWKAAVDAYNILLEHGFIKNHHG